MKSYSIFLGGVTPRITSRFTSRTTGALFCAAVLLLGSRIGLADDCPLDMQPAMPANEETLPHEFQPPDGDILHRYRFVPPNAGPNDKFPTVLVLPPDVWKLEYEDHGVPTERLATYDLQQARFLVFQVEHRLAPPGALLGQLASVNSGRFPAQTDDIKRQILAALADPQCNGKIYLVGGSAGGNLALWVMLDSTAGLVTDWTEAARTSIRAVVTLSAPTNLDDWNNPGMLDTTTLMKFENDCDNYVGLPDQDHTDPTLLGASPWNLVKSGAATSSPAVLLYATVKDPVPYEQADVMYKALTTHFVNTPGKFTEYVLSDTTGLHAFNYWHTQNTVSPVQDCVSHQVIAFLEANP